MIVPTMSYIEIYSILEIAAPKVRIKTEQLRVKAVKYFTRAPSRPRMTPTSSSSTPPVLPPPKSRLRGASAIFDTGIHGR